MVVLDSNFVLGCGRGTNYPLIHISQCMLKRTYATTNIYCNEHMLKRTYATTNICYNERGSRTNYVRSSIPHCK